MKSVQSRLFKDVIVALLIAGISILNTPVLSLASSMKTDPTQSSQDDEKAQKNEVKKQIEQNGKTDSVKEDTADSTQSNQDDEKAQKKEDSDVSTVKAEQKTNVKKTLPSDVTDPRVETTEPEIDGNTMLYIGGAIGAISLIALGVAAGTSSSDSDSISEQSTPAVGPNLHGTNWGGFLEIKQTGSAGREVVTAKVTHNGSAVSIATSTSLSYGRAFNGTITSSGSMRMYDATTGETWTTYRGRASTSQIDLYDYVNGAKELDRLFLGR